MDDASADLIFALQMQDLVDRPDDSESKEVNDNTSPDARMARDLYREELRNEAAVIANLRFAEKFGEATDDQPSSPIESTTPMFDQEGSSIDFLETGQQTCVVCSDELRARPFITAPCGHHYCKTCIGQLYDLAMKDESLFPPRCCRQPIPLGIATRMLTSGQVQKFLEKSVEFSAPNRTYCHDTSCLAFIKPDNISGEKAMCACGALTCVICKAAAHEGDCPKDPAYASLMAFAATEGYQTCRQCKRLVELAIGCNHMT